MSTTPVYKHQSFTAPRHIRLLDVEPALTASAEVRCELREVSLDDDPFPTYFALSYCWEGQIPDSPVFCAGCILNVTKNCLAAITKLRREHDTVTLWIDSVCIDQTNTREKSVQVALMANIYKSAEQVIIWLGEWDDDLRKAVQTVKDITGIQDLATFERLGEAAEDEERRASQMQQALHARARLLTTATQQRSNDVLGALYHRPWFSRMWTIQEVALARGDNIVIYNGPDASDQLSWPSFVLATDALLVSKYPWVDLSSTVKLHKHLMLMINMKRYPSLKEIYQRKPGDLMQDPLVWAIMCDTRGKEATDAKDKVFALYSVLQELGIGTTLPLPDYSKQVEDIYREFTVSCIKHDNLLYVLFDAPSDCRHLRPGLASWVPDWSDPGWRSRSDTDCRIAVTRRRFRAAGSAEVAWKFSVDDRQLHLKGKIVDEIVLCGEPLCCLYYHKKIATEGHRAQDFLSNDTALGDYISDTQGAYTILKSWVGVCSWYDKYPTTGETPGQAFHRTLMQDYPIRDNNERQAFSTWFAFMTSSNPAMIAQYISSPGTVIAFSNLKGFVVTESGRMGTAPARLETGLGGRATAVNLVKPGDRVAVIAGLEMPIVLRPIDIDDGKDPKMVQNSGKRVYQLVTHAYIHGIMYGEAWKDETKGLEDIVLV